MVSSAHTASHLELLRCLAIIAWPLVGLLWLIFWVGGWFDSNVAMWGCKVWAVLFVIVL